MYSNSILIKVAELYYQRKLSQRQIAEELKVSVPTVSRMLQECLDTGIVKVQIVNIENRVVEMENRIKEKFGLEKAIVIETPTKTDDGDLKKLLGKQASELLFDICIAGEKIGISAGGTIFEFIESLSGENKIPGVQIIPMMGSWGSKNPETETNKLVSSMASALKSDFDLLPAPAIVSSEEVKNIFLNEPQIIQVVHLWNQLDSAIFSIGPEIENSLFPTLTDNPDAVKSAKSKGAVGDIAGRVIDQSGNELDIDYNRKLLSIPLDTLKRIPKRVGIGGGANKYRSVKAALEANLINYLISDYDTCKFILENGGTTL